MGKPDDALTDAAMKNPQPGDRFTELFAFWFFVLERVGDKVITLEANAPCTVPRDGKLRAYETVGEFIQRFAYGSIPGYWVHLVDRGNDYSEWKTAAKET